MDHIIRVQAPVLPGHRLEIVSPELPEKAVVDVTILIPQPAADNQQSLAEFLRGLPPGPRSANTWEEIEDSIQAERIG